MSDNPWPEILVIGGTMYAIYIVLKLVVWLFVGTKTVVGATIEHGPSATAKALDVGADVAGHPAAKVDHARDGFSAARKHAREHLRTSEH